MHQGRTNVNEDSDYASACDTDGGQEEPVNHETALLLAREGKCHFGGVTLGKTGFKDRPLSGEMIEVFG